MTGQGGLTIEESARRLGHARWWSQRLFQVIGAWVPSVPEPDLKLRLATSARHHAWHADLFGERLPEVGHVDAESQTVAPSDAVAALFDELANWRDPERSPERLTVLARVVLPQAASVVREHLDRCTPVADAAVARTLRFVAADLVDDWLAGEATLQQWTRDSTMARRVESARTAFEQRWLASGGLAE